MIRQPIKDEKPIRVLGVDPGFASTGLSLVSYHGGVFTVLGTNLITTKKQDKKAKVNLRSNMDDLRRIKEIYTQLDRYFRSYSDISAMAVEAYTVSGPRAGNAWKAALVYGGVLFYGISKGIYTAPFMPMDVKRRFCVPNGTSKEDVIASLRTTVHGFTNYIDNYPKTKREHVADATAHAVLMIEEILANRVMFGI